MEKYPFPGHDEIEKFKQALNSDRGAFGPFMITKDPAFIECAGYSGYDFVLMDMEHGPGSYESLQNLIRAANAVDIMSIVRIQDKNDIYIAQALDVGAGAVLVPQVETAEQAKAAVAAAKFSPVGNRGTCRYTRSACYGGYSSDAYFRQAQNTMLMVQAEGTTALENLDEILEVKGIDVIFVGPYDLSASLNIIGQIEHPKIQQAVRDIVAKADAKGVKVGCFATETEMAKRWRDAGVRLIGYSCDTNIFLEAARKDVKAFNTP